MPDARRPALRCTGRSQQEAQGVPRRGCATPALDALHDQQAPESGARVARAARKRSGGASRCLISTTSALAQATRSSAKSPLQTARSANGRRNRKTASPQTIRTPATRSKSTASPRHSSGDGQVMADPAVDPEVRLQAAGRLLGLALGKDGERL